jgi:hypothetical protein
VTALYKSHLLWVVILWLPGTCCISDEPKNEAQNRSDVPPDYDAMISALGNKNVPPALVDVRGVEPLFPADYDWDEERHIQGVWGGIWAHLRKDPQMWEHLLDHFDDKRYALTMDDGSGHLARIYSVGELCEWGAKRLLNVGNYIPHVDRRHRKLLSVYVTPGDIRQWRKERAEMQLYELQIELCKVGLARVNTLLEREELPKVVRARLEERIDIMQAKIETLESTKKPIVTGMPFEGREVFNQHKAKRIRAWHDKRGA